MTQSVTADDARYKQLFDVKKETVDHRSGQLFGDLSPAMDALRDRAPVMKGSLRQLLELPGADHSNFDTERPHYTLLSFIACDYALRENLIFSSAVYRESPGVRSLGRTILEMTGEEHRRYRGVVQPMFIRPKAMTWWKENWIDGIVSTLLDRLKGFDRADLNFELCARMPVHVVTQGIGMSGDDALTFREHVLRSMGGHEASLEERGRAHAEAARMLHELISARRANPQDDVVSGLVTGDLPLEDGTARKLTDEEIFSYCRLIMLAGGGTTWRQLGITLVALLRDYRLWEACRDDRTLIERAIEESARWMPTDPTFPRLITEDVDVEGFLLPAGSRVDMCLGAANRDPSRWDNAAIYDPFRVPQNQLGFGMGPHRCLGMEVAKQEMLAALNGLMDRFPNMRLDTSVPAPQLMGGLEQRGMTSVPVAFH